MSDKKLDEAIKLLERDAGSKDFTLKDNKDVPDEAGFGGSGKEKLIERKNNIDKAIEILKENNKE